MIKSEAVELVSTLMDLWPSKFSWTPTMIDVWVERLTRDELNRDQCEAVIRDERVQDEGNKPRMKRIIARCYEAHKVSVAEPAPYSVVTDAEWAVIHRDREDAAAWWFQNREDAEAIVAQAIAAYPMFAAQFKRFTVEGFKPKPNQCMSLKCAWNEYQTNGARPKPAHVPGVMSRVVSVA